MFDFTVMQNMVWGAFAKQRDSWPPALKEALGRFEVDLVQDPGQIRIVCKNNPGVEDDPDVEKAKQILLNAIMQPLPQIISAFGCKTKVFK